MAPSWCPANCAHVRALSTGMRHRLPGHFFCSGGYLSRGCADADGCSSGRLRLRAFGDVIAFTRQFHHLGFALGDANHPRQVFPRRDVGVANALKKTVTMLPAQRWQSLTWDRGKGLSDHARFTIESGVRVFFADPHSPWQRGTNENTNGLLRQYFSKGTDLSRWSEQEIQAVARTLNNRPRTTLGWKTPAEILNEYLKSVRPPGVATTG